MQNFCYKFSNADVTVFIAKLSIYQNRNYTHFALFRISFRQDVEKLVLGTIHNRTVCIQFLFVPLIRYDLVLIQIYRSFWTSFDWNVKVVFFYFDEITFQYAISLEHITLIGRQTGNNNYLNVNSLNAHSSWKVKNR
jgi:hypothetical protein